jgi:hypothetical protein
MGQHRLADRHHARGAQHQGDADDGDPGVVAEKKKPERRRPARRRSPGAAALAPAAVVGPPAPGVRREHRVALCSEISTPIAKVL